MADAQQIADFKARTGGTIVWDDEVISAFLDTFGADTPGVELEWDPILAEAWTRRAAETANLVSTSESGSSRSLDQVHKNALSMAKYYGDLVVAGEPVVSGKVARTRPVVRENGL